MLLRVLFVDALTCPRCSVPLVVLAFLSDPLVTAKILRHLDLPATALPLAPAEPAGGEDAGYGPLFPDGARSPGARDPGRQRRCRPPRVNCR